MIKSSLKKDYQIVILKIMSGTGPQGQSLKSMLQHAQLDGIRHYNWKNGNQLRTIQGLLRKIGGKLSIVEAGSD